MYIILATSIVPFLCVCGVSYTPVLTWSPLPSPSGIDPERSLDGEAGLVYVSVCLSALPTS